MQTLRNRLRIFLVGLGMGAADLVPGVSGGTIAFIFGIYEELIQSITTTTGKTLHLLLRGKIVEAFKSVPWGFLLPLGIGILITIASLSQVIAYLLAEQPIYIWSFFFGLVVASIFIVGRRVVTWDAHDVLAMAAAAVASYLLVGIVPVETPDELLWYFGSGAIAIMAMILPGISGSFILVLLGKYEQVLTAINNQDFLPVIVLLSGSALGLALFARVVKWLFLKYHDITIAILTGLLIGSLRKIWPWKEPIITRVDSDGMIVPVIERNFFPPVDGTFFAGVGLMVGAIILMVIFEKMQATKHHIDDIEDTQYEKQHKKALKAEEHPTV